MKIYTALFFTIFTCDFAYTAKQSPTWITNRESMILLQRNNSVIEGQSDQVCHNLLEKIKT